MQNAYYDEEETLAAEEPQFEPEPEEPKRADAQPSASDPRYTLAVQLLRQTHETLGHVLDLMSGGDPKANATRIAELMVTKRQMGRALEDVSGSRVLEGVFDGSSMIGSDGKHYAVPPNYASKSRLVEGDVLKLTIRPDGTFIFKQIGPMERKRIVGCLAFDASNGSHVVICGTATYKVLPASVSFFRGDIGDEAVCLVPKSGTSVWAAVENIMKK